MLQFIVTIFYANDLTIYENFLSYANMFVTKKKKLIKQKKYISDYDDIEDDVL